MAFPQVPTKPNYTFDSLLEIHDGTEITTTGAGSAVIDTGGSSRFKGDCVIDLETLLISDDDELYKVQLQGSTDNDFGTGVVVLAEMDFGANEVLTGSDTDSTAGRYVMPFDNIQDGVIHRHLRLLVTVSGTTTSITFTAFLAIGQR